MSDYQPPELSIYESEDATVEWAALRSGEAAPDDVLGESPVPVESFFEGASGSPEPQVLKWSAPEPAYAYPDADTFVAPADPSRKVSGPTEKPKKTTKPGKVTRAHSTKTRLSGKDAFGGAICTCNIVCTCDQVCTCEAVATCSCVSDSGGGGGGTCSCDAVCTCQGVSTCTCQADTPCSCQAEPF